MTGGAVDLRDALWALAVVFVAWAVLRSSLRAWLRPRRVVFEFATGVTAEGGELLVMVHGLGGRSAFQGAIDVARSELPTAASLIVDYDTRPFSNLSPAAVADLLEREVHRRCREHDFRCVVMVGHSLGGAIVRKALVWGHGEEADRDAFGAQGKREWVDRVERVVLLAGLNRGFSIEPRPQAMSTATFVAIWLALRVAALFGIGALMRSAYRGAPFIADTRVQWLRVARSDAVVAGRQRFPTVIQLVGTEDDIVSREDSMDLAASRGSLFKSLPQTNHRDIADLLERPGDTRHHERVQAIRQALRGDLAALEPDHVAFGQEDRTIEELVYVMHGIRDYGFWTDVLRQRLQARLDERQRPARVVNHMYGFFPMAPFIVYADRQRNVRRFMDDYTESLARFPNVAALDYVGHSNGTYILASALVHYRTLNVRRVFFAGSVVPKHYPWAALRAAGRVQQVVNVVATRDWVVALFPKLFEQIADWLQRRPVRGWLDIGAAGFRGFLDAGDASGAVRNVSFAVGGHSTGVAIEEQDKLDAILAYVVDADPRGLSAFETARGQTGWLDGLSNVSYLVWLALAAALLGLGWVLGTWLGAVAVGVYGLLLLALLHSV